jgi:hypothetical protein
MPDSCSVIGSDLIGNIITAVSVICAVIVTFCLEEFRKKREFKRMNRHEIYQKRLALYEEVIKELSSMAGTDEAIAKLSNDDLNARIIGLQHTLLTLINRLTIYGSPRSIELLRILITKLRSPTLKRIPVYLEGSYTFHKSLLLRIDLALTEFAKTVRKEMGIDSVDKEIAKHYKKIDRKDKEQEVNKP